MFSAFSWGDFVQGMILFLSCYYLVVGILFYRAEMKQLLSGFTTAGLVNKNKDVSKSIDTIEKENPCKEKPVNPAQETVEQSMKTKPVEAVTDVYIELEETIEVAKIKNIPRSELLASLQTILKKYKNHSDKDYAEALREHVQSQLTIYSFQPLTDEELEHVWLN